jgi:DNA-3-methyladenine glycosylase I
MPRSAPSTPCLWPGQDPLMIRYHDEEWGVPVHDDDKHFEFMVLDTFQAGLSWKTILHKRENFRRAFDGFNYRKISRYTDDKLAALLQDAGIIRNRLKVQATVGNARAFMDLRREFGTFDDYVWSFTGGKTIQNRVKDHAGIPVTSPESDALSKDLYSRGFKFVGSTIVYAYMQAAGLVNDHLVGCPRQKACGR